VIGEGPTSADRDKTRVALLGKNHTQSLLVSQRSGL
jgi:hypothetical protein